MCTGTYNYATRGYTVMQCCISMCLERLDVCLYLLNACFVCALPCTLCSASEHCIHNSFSGLHSTFSQTMMRPMCASATQWSRITSSGSANVSELLDLWRSWFGWLRRTHIRKLSGISKCFTHRYPQSQSLCYNRYTWKYYCVQCWCVGGWLSLPTWFKYV